MSFPPRLFLLAVLVGATCACAAHRYHEEGLSLLEQGKVDEGMAKLAQAVQEQPGNARYRLDLAARRETLISRWLAEASAASANLQWDAAEELYKRVQSYEPGNSSAAEGLRALALERRDAPLLRQARDAFKQGDFEQAIALVAPVRTQNPTHPDLVALLRDIQEARLRHEHAQPVLKTAGLSLVTMRFEDANVRSVFEALARSSGMNFIFDKDVAPDLRTTINLAQVSVEDAVELLLRTNRLRKKVLDGKSVLVYQDTPEKVDEYDELMVKGFYLANTEAKQAEALLKTILKVKDLYVDERLNLIVMRGTPEMIRLAENLITMQDVYEPEVMLELAVMEVQRSRLTELGIEWPNQVSFTPLSRSGSASTTLSDLGELDSNRIRAVVGSATINLRRELTDANILANPRIRVRNKERADVLIGDRVPVLTTTATATGFVSENIQYLDVGLKLNVEPSVYLQDDVAIRVALEVSSIVREITTASGALAYQIGTRNANTVLRLKDGETQVLAGLISDEDRSTASRIPGLGDLPILNRIFGSKQSSRNKTEILLSITPHIVRNVIRADPSVTEFWSGTENTLRTRPLTIQSVAGREAIPDNESEGRNAETGSNENAVREGVASPDGMTGSVPTKVVMTWQGPRDVKVGEELEIALHVSSDGGLRALPMQVFVDPEAFEIVKVGDGGFFRDQDGQSLFESTTDELAGKVFIGMSRTGTEGVRGEGDLVVLVLKALRAKVGAMVQILAATPLEGAGTEAVADLPEAALINVTE